ncbi:MAG: hypothetical protein NZ561_01830, partial [Phycisphaerae bacterium]|nr:hypothetical protein [Phycisphaerae bacterium]MDW8261823.1 hypothetical protein [Phycisphaerales bacterium]
RRVVVTLEPAVADDGLVIPGEPDMTKRLYDTLPRQQPAFFQGLPRAKDPLGKWRIPARLAVLPAD